jgi:hypothetical protein
MNLEDAFVEWRRMYEIGIGLLKMRSEIGASICFFRFGGIFPDIIPHPPQNVKPCDVQYRWVIGNIKITKEFLGGR